MASNTTLQIYSVQDDRFSRQADRTSALPRPTCGSRTRNTVLRLVVSKKSSRKCGTSVVGAKIMQVKGFDASHYRPSSE
ncbi:hypothetical protein ARMGADRAFT_82069 [Armillaria gallica]|uniref:Uncharacterized protein n=1 Tax=Armillaria gallica TaxID=47427 RepID=A0A2H3CTY4_ARMGA|nr:hypothetical protein ARMGADRAFT_82069 [Armillaria gallica]